MKIKLDDTHEIRTRVVAGGSGCCNSMEVHGFGTTRHIAGFRNHTDKYYMFDEFKNIRDRIINFENNISLLIKNKKFKTDEEVINLNGFIITWDKDCYALKRLSGMDGKKLKNLGYYCVHHLYCALVDYLELRVMNSNLGEEVTSIDLVNFIDEEAVAIKNAIEKVNWDRVGGPSVLEVSTPKIKKITGFIKIKSGKKK